MYTYIKTDIYLCVYIYIHFQVIFHYRLLNDIEYSSLCPAAGPCLFILYIVVHNSSFIFPLWIGAQGQGTYFGHYK